MRVLLVDDSPTMRRILRDALKGFGGRRGGEPPEVVEAGSGEEALGVLRRDPGFDLVLLDWHLPGITGLEVLKAMQADSGLSRIPAVMVTQEREKANVIAALRAGAKNYIVKPFTKQAFRKKLAASLEGAKRAASRPAGSLVGNLGQTSPLEVLQLMTMTRKTGVLELKESGGEGHRFEIFFEQGGITHAQGEGLEGEEAVEAACALASGTFAFKAGLPAPGSFKRTVSRTTEVIMLDALKRMPAV